MMQSHCLSFLAILFSVVACAPVSYEASYRPPAGHVSAYKASHSYTRPIQVTLYSDSTYLGVNFAPIQIVISDGDYVEIPVKNRRGRSSRIFAHYHRGNLHFDSNRKCQKIQGSTGYQYDKRWGKGYKYAYVSAGHDYDFTGLRLLVRNAPKLNSRPKKVSSAKAPKIHKKTIITNKYPVVKYNKKTLDKKKVVARKQLKNVPNKVVVTTKTPKQTKQSHSDKPISSGGKYRAKGAGASKNPILPHIVRVTTRHDRADKHMVAAKKNVPDVPAVNHSVAAQGRHARNVIKLQQPTPHRKTVNAAAGVSKAKQDKGAEGRGPVSKKAKEVHSVQGKVSRAQGQEQLKVRSRNNQGAPEVVVMARPLKRDRPAHAKKIR